MNICISRSKNDEQRPYCAYIRRNRHSEPRRKFCETRAEAWAFARASVHELIEQKRAVSA